MTESKHTPGPWRLTGQATIRAGDYWIASVYWGRRRPENARLIAAAPELLSAALRARRELEQLQDGGVGGIPNAIVALIPEAIQALDAAIAKATGAA